MIIFYFTSPKLLVILKNSSFINSYKFLYKFCRVLSLVFVLFKLKFIKYRRRQIMFAITTEVILTHTPQSIFSDGITHIPRYEFAQGLLLWFLDIRETKKNATSSYSCFIGVEIWKLMDLFAFVFHQLPL